MKEQTVHVNHLVTKSNLPVSDYVINPYIGCPHGCRYCYARFMKRFTKHEEAWGEFVDIKETDEPLQIEKLEGKRVFLSSVTDPYNPAEEKYQKTRGILQELTACDCFLSISTRSSLILRDIDLLKQMKHLTVSVSLNTLNEEFREDMDHGASTADRLRTLKTLHENGIYAILFLSPIFPGITDFKEILEISKDFTDHYWFENLNLREPFRSDILAYIDQKYPHLHDLYESIYKKKDMTYWQNYSAEIDQYCHTHSVSYTNFFYHSQLVRDRKAKESSARNT
ncbi:MAG: radical SAM protein [Erysipelotrichia bacterium]|nr:radical SAM protein [Erysipelotrichia bacterium]